MKTLDAVILLMSDSHGVYIPQFFADDCLGIAGWHGVSSDDADILAQGPEHENYWDSWYMVLNNATYTDKAGNVYRLWQDGNLWAYCLERMTLEEQVNLFGAVTTSDFHVGENCELHIIAEHYLPALVNGDYSGLEDYEIAALSEFVAENGDSIVDSASHGFSRCEITGLMADCQIVSILQWGKK